MNNLFLKNTSMSFSNVEKIIQGIILFVSFSATPNQITRARAAITHAYDLCLNYRDVQPSLVYRICAHMVGLCTTVADKLHWLNMAIKCSKGVTLSNLAVMSLMLSFTSTQFSKESDYSFKQEDTYAEEYNKYNAAVSQYLAECEQECGVSSSSISPRMMNRSINSQSFDLSTPDYAAFQQAIMCCRCFHYSFCGNSNQAFNYAKRAIVTSSHIAEPFAPVFVGLAHVLGVLRDYNHINLFAEGIQVFQSLLKAVPHGDGLFEISSPRSLSPSPSSKKGHGQYMDPLYLGGFRFSADDMETYINVIQQVTATPSPLAFTPTRTSYAIESANSSVMKFCVVKTSPRSLSSSTDDINSIVGSDALFTSPSPDPMMLESPVDVNTLDCYEDYSPRGQFEFDFVLV
eukprot:TRINITY_DN2202_c0_g1_i2.p1 TRINITY_DN2202_c0_g1~~TRINITY_DN2202_c0_g1_i2.p1  ORF type:complete len:402 (+),score=73.42 TRINITY_DN2202_c0_g1_i2:755-1960(+)